MANNKQLILASKSPRRKQLLSQLGMQFIVMDVDIDETQRGNESPIEYVSRVAEQKTIAAFNILTNKDNNEAHVQLSAHTLILSADTCIMLERQLIGKPSNAEHSEYILRQLSGKKHQVLSAVCLLNMESSDRYQVSTRMNKTEVEFKHLSNKDISDYWRTGEPIDKAGSYAIQGLGASFIKSIQGSYSAVMGLPLYETTELLSACGIDIMRIADKKIE